MNKKAKSLLCLGSLSAIVPVASFVTSCSNDDKGNQNNSNSVFNAILNEYCSDIQFSLNKEQRGKITAKTFADKLNSIAIYDDAVNRTMGEYIDGWAKFKSLEIPLASKGVTFSIVRKIDNNNTSIMTSFANSVNFDIQFVYNGPNLIGTEVIEKQTFTYTIVGFWTAYEQKQAFEKEVKTQYDQKFKQIETEQENLINNATAQLKNDNIFTFNQAVISLNRYGLTSQEAIERATYKNNGVFKGLDIEEMFGYSGTRAPLFMSNKISIKSKIEGNPLSEKGIIYTYDSSASNSSDIIKQIPFVLKFNDSGTLINGDKVISYSTPEEMAQHFVWNESDDASTKGKKLTLNFKIQREVNIPIEINIDPNMFPPKDFPLEGEIPAYKKTLTRDISIELTGFDSYKERYAKMVEAFNVNNNANNSGTPMHETWKIKAEYGDNNTANNFFIAVGNKATVQEKMNFINSNIVNGMLGFQRNPNKPNEINFTQDPDNPQMFFGMIDGKNVVADESLMMKFNSCEVDSSNDKVIKLKFTPSYRGYIEKLDDGKTDKTCEKSIVNFNTIDGIFQAERNKFESINLLAKNTSISSYQVVSEYKVNVESIYQNVAGIPLSNDIRFKYIIKNISWNEGADPRPEGNDRARGQVLNLSINLQYYSPDELDHGGNPLPDKKPLAEYERSFNVGGYKALYAFYQDEFNKIVGRVRNNRNYSIDAKKAKDKLVTEITDSNWKEYVIINNKVGEGFPVGTNNNGSFAIKNLRLDHTRGDGGGGDRTPQLGLKFRYEWITKKDGEANISGLGFESEEITIWIRSDVMLGFTQKATQNFFVLNNDSNFIKNSKVSGEAASNWLTSYFGYDLKLGGTNVNSSKYKTGFRRLYDIPYDPSINIKYNFGIQFDLLSVEYSKDLNYSIKNTELKVKYRVTNKYDTTLHFERTELLTGFMDPFCNEVYDYSSKPTNWDITPIWTGKYNDAPADLRKGDANWQTTWAAWGNHQPYSYYVSQDKSNWVNWLNQPNSIPERFRALNKEDSKKVIKNYRIEWVWRGEQRRGYKDIGGTCSTPAGIAFSYKTIATDKRDNTALNKYKDYTTNTLCLWLYWKNNYWK